MEKYILSLDLGTTSMKAQLFDFELNPGISCKVDCMTDYPHPGWAEQDTDQWWKAIITAVALMKERGVETKEIALISIDAMTPTIVPVDKDGKALRKAILWMDRRSEAQTRFLDKALGNQLFEINGNHNDPSNFSSKVLWVKDNEPEIYAKTEKFLFATGFLVAGLTEELTMDKTQTGLSQLCNTLTGKWSDELIALSGIDQAKLPSIYQSTDIVGGVTKDAALKTGLRENTSVIAGAMDNVAAGLGAGIYENRQLYVSAGTATNVCICTADPRYHQSFHVYPHIVEDLWIQAAGVDYGGAGYKWFANLIQEKDYAGLDKEAAEAAKEHPSLIYLPYMVGQRAPLWNSHTRGVLFGMEPSVSRGAMALAFMEGNALAVKKILELTREMGIYPEKGRLTGGCSESDIYSAIFSDTLNLELERMGNLDTATLGMAMTGARTLKLYPSYAEMPVHKEKNRLPLKPDSARVAYYEKAFELFEDLYGKLGSCYEDLSALREYKIRESAS